MLRRRKGGREWENPPLCPTAPNRCKIQNSSMRLFLKKNSRQLRSRHFTMAPAQVIIPPFPTFYFQVTKFDPFPYVEREYNSNFRRIIRELRAGGEVVGGGEGKQTSTDGVARVNFTMSGGSLVYFRARGRNINNPALNALDISRDDCFSWKNKSCARYTVRANSTF